MATENIPRIASDFETQLSASISIGATSFTIQDVVDADGTTLSDGLYCFTIARNSTSEKEYLFGQLTTATKTVSSVYTVSRQGVLTVNVARAHRIGSNVIISDHGAIAAISRIFSGQGTINPASPLEYTTAPTLSSATQIATKGYVDGIVSGGTVNTDRIILGSQTAGETVAAGNIVYFKSSDSRWWLADADLTATFSNVQLGVVQIYGKCDSFTGLTATSTYYLSNTAGAVSSSAGTYSVILGQAFATTGIFFNPEVSVAGQAISTSAGAGDAGKIIKTASTGYLDKSFTTTPTVQTFTASGTWTKPTGLKYAIVEISGSGAGGGSALNTSGNASGGGGGGGGYCKKLIAAASLGATETVTIGALGAGGAPSSGGSNGGNSTFGAILTANGGTGGAHEGEGGAGGTATGGDINIAGGKGGDGDSLLLTGRYGGYSFYGFGGAPSKADGSNAGVGYGSGGSGATDSGDAGGDTGGNGTAGICIVTEYYN